MTSNPNPSPAVSDLDPKEVLVSFAKAFIHKFSKDRWAEQFYKNPNNALKDVEAFPNDLDRRFVEVIDYAWGIIPDHQKGWCYDFKSIPKWKPFSTALEKGEEQDLLFIVDPRQEAVFFRHGEETLHCQRN